jgi:hypothetical protein
MFGKNKGYFQISIFIFVKFLKASLKKVGKYTNKFKAEGTE